MCLQDHKATCWQVFQILFTVLQTSKKHCRKKCGLIHKNFRTSVFGTEALTAKFTQIHCFTSSQPWIMRGDKREFVILGKSGWGPRGVLLSHGFARPGLTTPFSASKTNPSLSHLGIITLTSLNHHSHTKHSHSSNQQIANPRSIDPQVVDKGVPVVKSSMFDWYSPPLAGPDILWNQPWVNNQTIP